MVTRESAIKTAQYFIKDCNSIGLTFFRVFLFGSMAKGNIHEWSDIDLLLINEVIKESIEIS